MFIFKISVNYIYYIHGGMYVFPVNLCPTSVKNELLYEVIHSHCSQPF